MADRLVHTPETRHRCDVGWSERTFDFPSAGLLSASTETTPVTLRGQWDRPGTVRQCECGRYWIAREFYQPLRGGWSSQRIEWRPESRLHRWWRERRSRG